jgi:hypothetical protein
MKIRGNLKADDVMKLATTSQRNRFLIIVACSIIGILAIIVIKEKALSLTTLAGIKPIWNFIKSMKSPP